MACFNVRFIGGPFDGAKLPAERAPQDGEEAVFDINPPGNRHVYRYVWNRGAFYHHRVVWIETLNFGIQK